MSTKVNGVNVTVFEKLDIASTVYVGGNQLTLADGPAIDVTDPFTNLTEIAVDRLFFDGQEITATGAAIPSSFRGTKLKNVNVTQDFSVNGMTWWSGDYTQNRVRFTDTDPDYLEQIGDLGISGDTTGFTFSAWFEIADNTSRHRFISIRNTGDVNDVFMCQLGAGPSDVQSNVFNNGGTSIGSISSSGGTSNNVLYHVIVTFDTTDGFRLYLDGQLQDSLAGPLAACGTSIAESVYIGSTNGAGNFLDGCLGDIWFDNTFIDMSVEENLRKFRTSAGTPTFLGENGELPTGSQPLLFFGSNQDATDWNSGTNLGTGGSFTMTGSVDPCAL